MKKISAIAVFGLLILLSFHSPAASQITPHQQFILENEEAMDEVFLRKYEPMAEMFSDRLNEQGRPTSVQDFIRPEETAKLIQALKLTELGLKQKVETIHSFVRKNFEFVPDEEDGDYWQYPAETIRRGEGDCEDLAFLLASILIEAGVPEELVKVNIKNWHAYATVEIDGEILILETDPNASHFYLYNWPSYRWNRQLIEKRIKRK
ncbi:MAG: transglutaminase-like domain-containing protein [bacterium]|nr:transglutaminase-like domain-containing protein [bacterium]